MKKNLFFKKRFNLKVLSSKRLSIILKKRKKKIFKKKKINTGNFFFKKFFFKTLLRGRKSLKSFFFLTKKVRQKKLNKVIWNNQKNFLKKNSNCEYTILNLLLISGVFFYTRDVLKFLESGLVYINYLPYKNYNTLISVGDCIQIPINSHYYLYVFFFKKFFKKKVTIYKYNSWKFFKQKFFKKKNRMRYKKRRNPNFLYLFFLFKLNIPKFLEFDYISMTLFFIKKLKSFMYTTYYLNKLFSFKFFTMYNFKKIN